MWQYLHELERGSMKASKTEHSSSEKRDKQNPQPKIRLHFKITPTLVKTGSNTCSHWKNVNLSFFYYVEVELLLMM